MARKRDVVIAVIIAVSFLVVFVFVGLMFIGLLMEGGDFDLVGIGGDVGVIELYGIIDETS
ncbi:MAG: hypothetical protein KAW91_03355, partial [candidate division Zixibacteria bacterium]|nr:hypothetical protein [candidate division Zixibacteria bacterium]